MDHADLTYEKMISKLGSVVGDNSSLFNLTISENKNVHYHIDIVNRLSTSFRFGSLEENQFRCLIFILGLRSPCHGPENDLSSIDQGDPLPSDNYPTNIRSCHSQDADFAEDVVGNETALSKTSLLELQRQWPQRRLLPRVFYEQFNEAEPEQQ
ncbi:hypothetical protein ACTXT7_003982 [Hymenolepis weldensis]